jgi:hypothetical protein
MCLLLRLLWGVSLRPLACWDCVFESRWRHANLCVVNVVYFQATVPTTVRYFVQGIPTKYVRVFCRCVLQTAQNRTVYMSSAFNLYICYSPTADVSLSVLQYRQNILWMPKKCSCAWNVVKIHYQKITLQGGLRIGLLIFTTRNFKCGYWCVVLFRRINIYFAAKYEAKLWRGNWKYFYFYILHWFIM